MTKTELQAEIAKWEKRAKINDTAESREFAQKKVDKLKAELDAMEEAPAEKKEEVKAEKPKAAPKKSKGKAKQVAKPKAEKKEPLPTAKTLTEDDCRKLLGEKKETIKARRDYQAKVARNPVTFVDTLKKATDTIETKIEKQVSAVTTTQAKAVKNDVADLVKVIETNMASAKDSKAFIIALIDELQKILKKIK